MQNGRFLGVACQKWACPARSKGFLHNQLNIIEGGFFSTFIYTDLTYRVCCWKIQKLNTTETEKKIKKKRREKKV